MAVQTSSIRYRNWLRAIGVHLDAQGLHSVSILEANDGIVVRGSAPGSRSPLLLEFPDEASLTSPVKTPHQTGEPIPHRLFRGGYTRFLQALGERLDDSAASAISIVEATDFVTIGGIRPVAEEDGGVMYEPLDILLLPDDIQALIERPVANMSTDDVEQAQSAHTSAEHLTSRASTTVGTAIESVLLMIRLTQSPVARSRG